MSWLDHMDAVGKYIAEHWPGGSHADVLMATELTGWLFTRRGLRYHGTRDDALWCAVNVMDQHQGDYRQICDTYDERTYTSYRRSRS